MFAQVDSRDHEPQNRADAKIGRAKYEEYPGGSRPRRCCLVGELTLRGSPVLYRGTGSSSWFSTQVATNITEPPRHSVRSRTLQCAGGVARTRARFCDFFLISLPGTTPIIISATRSAGESFLDKKNDLAK